MVELDTAEDGKALRSELGKLVGRTSVPAVWIKGKFVGGCNDGPLGGLRPLSENGGLVPMLKSAKAIR